MCYGLPRRGSPQNPSPVWYHKSGVGTIIINQIVVLNAHTRVDCATWAWGSRPLVRFGGVDQNHHRFMLFVWLCATFVRGKVLTACAVVSQTWRSLSLVEPFYGQEGPVSAGKSYWSVWGQ